MTECFSERMGRKALFSDCGQNGGQTSLRSKVKAPQTIDLQGFLQVLMTGLEPVRHRQGILSPRCLPFHHISERFHYSHHGDEFQGFSDPVLSGSGRSVLALRPLFYCVCSTLDLKEERELLSARRKVTKAAGTQIRDLFPGLFRGSMRPGLPAARLTYPPACNAVPWRLGLLAGPSESDLRSDGTGRRFAAVPPNRGYPPVCGLGAEPFKASSSGEAVTEGD